MLNYFIHFLTKCFKIHISLFGLTKGATFSMLKNTKQISISPLIYFISLMTHYISRRVSTIRHENTVPISYSIIQLSFTKSDIIIFFSYYLILRVINLVVLILHNFISSLRRQEEKPPILMK